MQVGLFKNKALIAWLEPCEPPEDFHEAIDRQFYCLSEGTRVTMANHSTDQLCFAAVVTDAYGRQLVHQDIPYLLQDGALAWPSSFDARSDPADWQYDA